MNEYEQNIEIMKDLRSRLDKVLETQPQQTVQPKDTGKWHFRLSIIKSGIRIGAALRLCQGDLFGAGVLFIIAEALGVLEEIV